MGEVLYIWMKLKEHMLKGIPEFYREVLGAWKEFLPTVEYKCNEGSEACGSICR